MPPQRPFHFLTFVRHLLIASLGFSPNLVYAAATPHLDPLGSSVQKGEQTSILPDDQAARATIDISPAPAPLPGSSTAKREYFYRYRNTVTLRMGGMYGNFSDDDDRLFFVSGGQFSLTTESLGIVEAGFDLHSDGSGVFHVARKVSLSRELFRPFWKVGAGLQFVPKERLLTVTQLRNYQVRGSIGFEETVFERTAFRGEVEATASSRGFSVAILIGHVWSW